MDFKDIRRDQLVSVLGHKEKKWRVTDFSERYHMVRILEVGEGITWLESLTLPAEKLTLIEVQS